MRIAVEFHSHDLMLNRCIAKECHLNCNITLHITACCMKQLCSNICA